MTDQANALAQQHSELLQEAMKAPGVVTALEVFRSAQGALALNDYVAATVASATPGKAFGYACTSSSS